MLTCNVERMTKLVKALRGEILREDGLPYEQAQEVLCDGSNHCCLGVAADLAVLDGFGRWVMEGTVYVGPGAVFNPQLDYDDQNDTDEVGAKILTPSLRGYYGLDSDEQFTNGGHGCLRLSDDAPRRSAMDMNDSDFSFDTIANWIDHTYLGGARPEIRIPDND